MDSDEIKTPAQHHAAMTWAQRLKRVFKIEPQRIATTRASTGPRAAVTSRIGLALNLHTAG